MIRTDFQHLLIREENGVLTITMNRPEVLNAFNETMIRELTAVLDEAVADEGVRGVVLTGAGRAFEIDLKTSLQLERNLQGIAVVSHDHHEGVIAFLQKRKAHYTGR
jgi:2-(1,2-epoxy-1,2-dihydrophenyl)acetyl-CoA isomerase